MKAKERVVRGVTESGKAKGDTREVGASHDASKGQKKERS